MGACRSAQFRQAFVVSGFRRGDSAVTPAVNAARKAGIPFTLHEYRHDARTDSYGLEAAEALDAAARLIKEAGIETDEFKSK